MSDDVIQGCLADATTASGLDLLRDGFGRTREDDVLYALGWPRLIWLESGDATPQELADGKLFSRRYPFREGPSPVGAVPRRVRFLQAWRKQNSDSTEAQNDASPITAKEREGMLDFALTEMYGFSIVFMLEAMFTTPVVLDGLVKRLRKLKPKALAEANDAGACLALHWLLLRTEPTRAAAHREEISAIHAAAAKHGSGRAVRALDLAVNGRAGVERSGANRDRGGLSNDLEYALDDLDFVRDRTLAFIPTLKSADRSWLSARLLYLGGDDAIALAAKHAKQIHTSARDDLALGMSRSAHPGVGALMTALGTPTAKRWLKDAAAAKPKPKRKQS